MAFKINGLRPLCGGTQRAIVVYLVKRFRTFHCGSGNAGHCLPQRRPKLATNLLGARFREPRYSTPDANLAMIAAWTNERTEERNQYPTFLKPCSAVPVIPARRRERKVNRPNNMVQLGPFTSLLELKGLALTNNG